MGRKLLIAWALLWVMLCAPRAFAAEAEDLSGKSLLTARSGFDSVNALFDGRTMEAVRVKNKASLTLEHEGGIASVYLVLGEEYPGIYAEDLATGEERLLGEEGYLHVFLDLEEAFGHAPEGVKLTFSQGDAKVAELSAFGPGEVPDWVQRWAPPLEGEADLVLFSSHGDDEQLFFAGMLPYYSRERGYNVQVVYMTDHRNMTMRRCHEMLDGLWAVGIRNYPVLGPFGDYNSRSAEEAYGIYRMKGISREEILSFVVENIRRFRPKVAVGHDLLGEYGHGMHMVYAQTLKEAVEISMDEEQFPDSAQRYGLWDVPKTYLHLYPENPIILDWDRPLDSFDGMTAFEVTRDLGFPCHVSQQSYYSWYFQGIGKASEILEYSPCEFGLLRTTVGPDREKNDFFEHMTSHSQDALLQAQWEAEAQTRPSEPEPLPAAEPTEAMYAETEPSAEPVSLMVKIRRGILGFFRNFFG